MSQRSIILAGLLLILSGWLFSCKKTDHYAQLVNDQPYLVTGEVGLYALGLGNYPGYSTSYLVGDTAMFVGKFFLDRPGSEIHIGNDTAHILAHLLLPAGTNEYTHQTDQLDVVRFLITQKMGIGNNIPVTIAANGVTIPAPAISIRQFQGIKRQTDTTLYVDSITNWKPTDMDFFKNNYLPLVQNANISGDGTICFGNLTGIYGLRQGQVTQWLKVGDQLQDQGVAFTINAVLGSVLSFDGASLIFSAAVQENTPDTATAFFFRLCKMDMVSRAVSTINRTEVKKGIAATNEAAGPYEGPVNTVKIVASNLKTDANGSIYYLNNYAPARTDFDASLWYRGTFGGGISTGSISYDPNVLNNICRVDGSGTVKSLFAQYNPYGGTPLNTVPGHHVDVTTDILVSLDGKTGYVCDKQGSFFISLGYFDLLQDAPLASTGLGPSGYRFFSYDTSGVTGMHMAEWDPTIVMFNGLYLNNFLILPDGDLLTTGSASLAAVNLQNKTVYCYAGTEAGLNGPPDVQNKTTGPAKYVLFSNSSTLFIGTDKLNTIYYYSGYQDYTNGLTFYKLYSRK